jgi:hypothetical protein
VLFLDFIQGLQYFVILVIRGTHNLRNAIPDLEYWKDHSPILGINLHRNFEKAARRCTRCT